jgi:hypothetical protein
MSCCLGLAILLTAGCSFRANQEIYGGPYTEDVSRWRQYLGVAVAIQFFLMALALWNTHHRVKMSRMFLALVFIPLLWTYPAELVYRLEIWILDWGWAGQLLAIMVSFLSGASVAVNVFSYLLGGVVFNDTRYLLYWSVPGVAAGYAAALFYITGIKGGRKK